MTRSLARHGRRPLAALLFAGVAVAISTGLTGCASSGSSGGLASAIASYDSGRYDESLARSTEIAAGTRGRTHEQASYVAGLSAYRLGDLDDAERRLYGAVRSSDDTTAGNANATLGLVRLAQDRPADAATFFSTAADQLDGDAARQAALHAGEAYERAGDPDSARTWRVIAGARLQSNHASAPSTRSRATFALQVGAFSERRRAEAAADDANRDAGTAGLGTARIVRRDAPRGDDLFVVQVGRFHSRSEAADARSRLGRLEYIVAPSLLAIR